MTYELVNIRDGNLGLIRTAKPYIELTSDKVSKLNSEPYRGSPTTRKLEKVEVEKYVETTNDWDRTNSSKNPTETTELVLYHIVKYVYVHA